MKSDKLLDAIGMIDADLIAQADKTVNKSNIRYLKWLVPVAATLLIVVAIIPFLKQDKPDIDNPIIEQTTGDDNFSGGQTQPNEDEPSTEIPDLPIIIPSLDDNPLKPVVYSIKKAEYPKMVKYPSDWMNSDWTSMEAWYNSKKERRKYYGSGKNLNMFLTKTFSEFLSGSNNENRLYSPLNVYMALAMTAEITDGESRQQILDLLGAESIDALRKQANSIWNANYSDDGAVTSILASSIWLNKSIKFNEKTLEFLTTNYYASSYQGQMGSDEMNIAFRSWLNEQTGGMLSNQIDNMELDAETVMALATTIFYQARWDLEFQEKNTEKGIFHSPIGDITCDFMCHKEYNDDYYWGNKFSAVGRKLANSGNMFFILPDENVSVNDLLSDNEALSFMASNGKWSNSKRIRINLSAPKFDVSSNIDLKDGLISLGVTNCFDSRKSDFSPLCNNDGLSISKVEHGVRVTIDEEGVVASAFTVEPLAGSVPPSDEIVDFILDRPFIFVITSEDGLPLFTGVVNQP